MKTCYFCKGIVEPARIDYMAGGKHQYVFIRDLAVEKCTQCGEVYFDPDASQQIDAALQGVSTPVDSYAVPVYQGH